MFQNRTVLDSIFDWVYLKKPTGLTAIDWQVTCQHWLLWRWPAAADHRSGKVLCASRRPCSCTGRPRARAGAHRSRQRTNSCPLQTLQGKREEEGMYNSQCPAQLAYRSSKSVPRLGAAH